MRTPVIGLAVLGVAAIFACSGTKDESGFGNGGSSSGGASSSSGASTGVASSGGASSSSGSTNLGSSNGSPGASSGGTTGDGGYVCAPNPLNFDIPGNGCDDDGNGKVDDVPVCDNGTMPPSNLSAVGTAADMLAALGICQAADSTHWGVVSATYTDGHSQTGVGAKNFGQQHGTLAKFGNVIVPREGSLLGVLSSGSATEEDSDNGPLFKGGKDGMQGAAGILKGNGGDVPSGFPKTSTGCATLSSEVNDVIDVKVQIKVPANAKGFAFDFNFWSGEWPDYVCTEFNDSFIAYLTSAAFNGGKADNISFDTKGNPISVDNDFFEACTPGVQTGCSGAPTTGTSTCTLGEAQLAGTGFGQDSPEGTYCDKPSTAGGATSWLTSTAPAQAGETISLEFIIWDTGDESYDSTVLLDNWVWQGQEVPAAPITQPSPPIK
jgi:hypothetical protein